MIPADLVGPGVRSAVGNDSRVLIGPVVRRRRLSAPACWNDAIRS